MQILSCFIPNRRESGKCFRIFPLLIFAVLFTGSLLQAQGNNGPVKDYTCTIFGTAPGCNGNVIGIYRCEDYITNTERKLNETIVDDSSRFSFTVEVTEVEPLIVRCRNIYATVYAEPGRKVEVIFPERDPKRHINPDVSYQEDMTIFISDSTDMNFLADDYNSRFYKWWGQNYIYFVSKDSIGLLDSFRLQMMRHYAFVKNPYFMPWMEYGLASIEDATFHSQVTSARKYLTGRKIHYNNSEYMSFFNNFFKGYMYKWSMRKEGQGIVFTVNSMASYDSLLGTMRNLPYLKNDTLRELVVLKGLFEIYDNPNFDARNVLAMAQQASVRSKIPQHRLIARNIVSFYSKLKRGSPAPHFIAVDRRGNEVDILQQYKGKYIYLFFFASWNTHSTAELRYMAELQKKYGKKIMFVSVSLDEDTNLYKAFLKANPKYNWTILHYDKLQKTKDDYNLYSVPAGFIIDEEGKFYRSPADNPSGDLEYDLYRIANPKAGPFIPPYQH